MGTARSAGVLASIAANVQAIRRKRGLTQMELAEKANVELRQLQRAESGRIDFGLIALVQIATALDVPPGRFFRAARLAAPKLGRPKKRAAKRGE